jgi:hypothetical protein
MLTAASGNGDALREELRSRALSSLYYFTKVVMGFADLVPHYHLQKCLEIQNTIGMKKRGFLWPRKTFKSTILKCYVLWRLCGGGYEGFTDAWYSDPTKDPRNKRWLLVGESEGRVVDAVKDIKHHILNNQMLQWLFPEIIPPDINKCKWRDDEIELNRSRHFDEGSIRAVGIDKKMTGYHGDGFFFDDVIGYTASQSVTTMDNAWSWIAACPGFINNQNDYEYVFAGTRWKFGNADIYGKYMAEQPFNDTIPGNPEGIKWYVYSALNEDGEPSFPERLSLIQLDQLRREMGDYLFSCQFLNSPSTPENADFPPEKIKTYRVAEDKDGKRNLLVPLDGTRPVYLWQLNRSSFLDPSSGGKSAKCENAIVGLGTAADGRQFVLYTKLVNCGYRAIIEYWHEANDQFVFTSNKYEKVGAQKTIEEFITEKIIYRVCRLCQKIHRRLVPVGVMPPGGRDKDDRIRAFLGPTVEESRLYLGQNHVALRAQIVQFPHAEMKDGVDALAYAVHESRRPSTEEEMLEDKELTMQSIQPKSPRTNTERMYGGYC